MIRLLLPLLMFCWLTDPSSATEMELELKDNAVQCFYEEIEQGKRCFLEFQVGLSFMLRILIIAHHQ